jgi:hypothetical protein
MANRKIFTDDSDNILEFYINKDGNLFLTAGER